MPKKISEDYELIFIAFALALGIWYYVKMCGASA